MAFPAPQVMVATGVGGGKNIAAQPMTGPASYVTGGVTVNAGVFNLNKLDFVEAMGLSTDGLNFVRIISTPPGGGASSVKVKWYVDATGLEVANGVNLSTKKIMCFATGV